jgi:phosphinothricin acetyltransferase
MDLKFSELREQDLHDVKDIYDWYVMNSTATFHTEPIGLDELREFVYVNHPLYRSYMILSSQRIAGYCHITHHKKRQAYNRTAEITLYLKPEFTKKGIGRHALAFLEQQARSVGLKNLIGTISGDNEASIALFEKSGYTKCAHYRKIGEKFNTVLDVVAYQKEI